MNGTRSTRNQPFCWQEKKILRLLRNYFEGAELQKFRNLYLTITEIDSDFNGKDIKFYTKTVSTYSGLSKDWIPKGLKVLEELKMIQLVEDREGGKFKGKRLIFTPENIEEIPLKTVHGKSSNGESVNGNLESSEDIIYLEDNINKENNNKVVVDDFVETEDMRKRRIEVTKFEEEMSFKLREKNLNVKVKDLLKYAGGDIELIKRQFEHFADKGVPLLVASIKGKYAPPKQVEEKKVKVSIAGMV